MELGLVDKTAVVTGAGSGIGAATARRLVHEGMKVLLADRDVDAAEAVAEDLAHGDVLVAKVDVTQNGDVARMVAMVVERWGRLDCAVNNAGIAQPATPIDRLTEPQFDALLQVNAKGVWLCLRHEIPALLATGGGAIVNVTSVASHIAAAGQAAYAGSKHAALGLTKGAALDYAAAGIRVVAVSPGLVDTPMAQNFVRESGDPRVLEPIEAAHPLGRSATPEEVADAIAWALSDRAAFMTGSAILVDGGYIAS